MRLSAPQELGRLTKRTVCPSIYRIVHRETGRCYIGSAWRPIDRKVRHERDIRSGEHTNLILVRAFAKYGTDAFTFEIVEWFDEESMTRERLFEVEQQYLDRDKPRFNISKDATYNTMSTEGKARRVKAISKTWIVTDPEGLEYEVTNLKEFCRERGLAQAQLWYVAQGKSSHAKGWRCRYADGSTPAYVNRAVREYNVTTPTGEVERIRNLKQYCRDHGLAYTGMMNILTGSQRQHRGYSLTKA